MRVEERWMRFCGWEWSMCPTAHNYQASGPEQSKMLRVQTLRITDSHSTVWTGPLEGQPRTCPPGASGTGSRTHTGAGQEFGLRRHTFRRGLLITPVLFGLSSRCRRHSGHSSGCTS